MSVSISTTKRKKPPACDYCKSKRVICHPQENGSCPRCLEKGVVCQSTPVIRRKRRTKAELERDRAESSSGSSSDVATVGSYSLLDICRPRATAISYGLAAPSLDLPPSLIEELFQDFRHLPQYHHPLFPLQRLESSLVDLSWRMHDLPPQDRVLVQCTIAVSARISSSVSIIGPGRQGIKDLCIRSPLRTHMPSLDLRSFGHIRESLCEQLRAEALWLAQSEGIMTVISVSNAASLLVLEFLETHLSGNGSNVYSSAYLHQLRELYEEFSERVQPDRVSQTKYSVYLLGNALSALLSGKNVPFAVQDELLLCGEDSTSLEQVLAMISPDSLTTAPIYTVMRPVSFHMIKSAREISEGITGANARRGPLNESKVISQLNALDFLHSVISAGYGQMQKLRDTLDKELFKYVLYCAYPLLHGWGTLVLTMFRELKRRKGLRVASVIEVEGSASGEAKRAQSRLGLLFAQVKAMTTQAALEIAESLEEIPMLSRVTHMNFSPLIKWARFLLEDVDDTDIDASRRIWALERFRDALNLYAFSWVDPTSTLEAVEEFLAAANSQLGSFNGTQELEEILGGLDVASNAMPLWPLVPSSGPQDIQNGLMNWTQMGSWN
ncbi:hypothetical protein GYMLUDRAFT_254695 [Collybiopsis luxurians FD-317 M1]|nr:hypothetical protein GYMLUDRAFT_254695 [Collybiopsis luxurians FD-317 M1]